MKIEIAPGFYIDPNAPEYYDLDATPTGEKCAQTGAHNYDYLQQQAIEIEVFKDLINRTFKRQPKGIKWGTHRNPHDFGVYLTLRLTWFENEAESEKVIEFCDEVSSIEYWDLPALQMLQDKGYLMNEFIDEDRLYKAPALQY